MDIISEPIIYELINKSVSSNTNLINTTLFDTLSSIAKKEKEKRKKDRKFKNDITDLLYEVSYDLGEFFENCGSFIDSCDKNLKRLENILNKAVNTFKTDKNFHELFIDGKTPKKGDHIFIQEAGYDKHGIYIGLNLVIYYFQNFVNLDTLENFSNNSKIQIKAENQSPAIYTKNEIVRRAFSKIFENKYNLLTNNCEHFARWCRFY